MESKEASQPSEQDFMSLYAFSRRGGSGRSFGLLNGTQFIKDIVCSSTGRDFSCPRLTLTCSACTALESVISVCSWKTALVIEWKVSLPSTVSLFMSMLPDPSWIRPVLDDSAVVGSNIYVDGGSTIALVCPFKADPANSIRWSGPPNLITLSIGFDINPNLPDAQRSRLSVSGNGSNGDYNLKIGNIQLHDEGVYRCNGVSSGSSLYKDLNLFIKVVKLSTYPSTAVEGKDYSFICSYVNSFIEFRTDESTICVIIGINANGTCNISGSYNRKFTYSCDSSTYNVTIPGLFLTESLHGTKWECLNVFDNSQRSGKKQLYVNTPITSVTLSNPAADENPVKVINGQKIIFTCRTNAGRPSAKIQWYLASVNITSSASSQTEVCATDCSDDKFVSSSQQIYKGQKDDSDKIIVCTALNIQGHGVKSSNKTIDVLYFPNIHMKPIYNPYNVYQNQQDVVLICEIDDANPSEAVTYKWNSPSRTVNTQNLTIPTVTKLHNGQYSCTATNIAGTSNKATKQLNVHYGPMISNISNQHDITEGNNLIVSPIVDANPVPKFVWWTKQNDANFRYEHFVLIINNINRKSSGNYSCYVMNTLSPSGMSEINITAQQTFSVNVVFKPFLDSTKPYSPGHVTATINSTLRLTLTVNAYPVPFIEWTFRADKDWNTCNFVTIMSNTISNEFGTSSSVLINNINSNNFGDYVFTARNTAGVFSRRFVVMEEALLRQEMFASTKGNTGMFLAGIVTLVVGLLSLTSSVIFVVRNRLKNKTIASSKTDQYSDVQRSNPAFTDPYTTLQCDIVQTIFSLNVGISGYPYIEPGVPYNVSCTVDEYQDNRRTTFFARTTDTYLEETTVWYYKRYGCFQLMSPVSILCINASCACDDNGLTTHWTYDTPSHLPTPVIFTCFSSDNESRIAQSDVLEPTILLGPGSSLQFDPSTNSLTKTKGEQLGPLNCSATCNPPCQYTWTKPDKSTIIGGQLIITSLSFGDHGHFICTASNAIGGSQNKSLDVTVNYSPEYVTLLPHDTHYNVTEGNNIQPINCRADCRPVCTFIWSGPNVPAGTTNVLSLQNINKNQKGVFNCTAYNDVGVLKSDDVNINVQFGPGSSLEFEPSATSLTKLKGEQLGPINCAATCNPPCQYTWTKPNTAIIDGGQLVLAVLSIADHGEFICSASNAIDGSHNKSLAVTVNFKPFLDQTRPHSPPYVSAAENNSLHLQLTVNANPTPTIEWKFRTQVDWDSCNFITIVSNTTTNRFLTSSSVLIDDEQSKIFGEYTFSANNTVGFLFRRFVVMKEANLARVKCPITNENTGMFLAGIVTLIVGLMSLTAAVIFVVRNGLKNKALNSSKFVEYSDMQRSNPAFTDAYTTLQSNIESTVPSEQTINNYEECGRTHEANRYSSVDKKDSEPSQYQQHGVNTYEECGKRIDAHAYDILDK
ncbi:hemicentin-1-like [Mytilus trossulus]|uniref:hemicentin-1-like n=1 Tax=Mytilus trossulus TaxID=6551 RepID=UPI003004C2FD